MALLLASLLALLATAAHAQFGPFNTSDLILGHNKSEEYFWAVAIPKGLVPSNLPDALYASPDACDNGNSGLRGLSFDRCVAVCSSAATCSVVAYYPAWLKGESACFAYSTTNATVLQAILNKAESATPVKLQDDNAKASVYLGLTMPGYGKNNYQNFYWSSDGTAAGSLPPSPLFKSSDPAVCDGDPDVGIPDLDLRQCTDLCLAIPNCLMLKFVPAGGLQGVSRCYAYAEVPSALVKNQTTLSEKLISYEEQLDPAYLGISYQYFQKNPLKPAN